MANKKRPLTLDEPIIHDDHRLRSRRDFIRQGFITGPGLILSGGVFSLFTNPRDVMAAVSGDLSNLASSFSNINCPIGGLTGDVKIPFITFDLAGGAGISTNVLVGKAGGQLDILDAAGYSKMGIPGNQMPGQVDATPPAGSNGDFTDSTFGLIFHSDAGFLRGIRSRAPTVLANIAAGSASVDGSVIAARSDNDTGNNPHNPMYGIAKAGAQGDVVTLIGSVNSESGANSLSPGTLIDPEIRPTKVDRPTDVTGMVDVGDLTAILDRDDVVAVMEAVARISHQKTRLGDIQTNVSRDAILKELVSCGYLRAADIAERFAGVPVDPSEDPDIVDDGSGTGIFTQDQFDGANGESARSGREYRKTASVMKMVIDGHAGAGSITMGGYDYHTGERGTGEARDLLAGECMGACLEYAAKKGQPLMIYVYSDGSVSSNGRVDNTAAGRGKPEWTGDNSSTACSFFLVYNPGGAISLFANGLSAERHRQLGYYTAGGSVVTTSSSAANNVTALAHTAILNFMALNGDVTAGNFAAFTDLFRTAAGVPTHGISNLASMTAFGDITP